MDEKTESDMSDGIGRACPIQTAGIGRRISAIADRVGGKKRLAEMANISESHLYRYISGASEPTASRLVSLADAAGVSVDWLATGRGSAAGARQERIDYADLDILEDVIEKTRRRFQDLGVKLSPDREARAIRLVFEFCLRHGESMDDASLAGIIELAALR